MRRHFETALIGSELTARSAIELYFNLGWLLLEEGDPQSAASNFVDILRTNRLNGTVWLNSVSRCWAWPAARRTATRPNEPPCCTAGTMPCFRNAFELVGESLEETIQGARHRALLNAWAGDFDRQYVRGQAMTNDEIIKLASTAN